MSAPPLPASLVAAMGGALFIADSGGGTRYVRGGPAPAWLARVWPDLVPEGAAVDVEERIPVLAAFLDDLAASPPAGGDAPVSPLWSESMHDAGDPSPDLLLEAVVLDGGRTVVVRVPPLAGSLRGALQEGREQALELDRLQREAERRETFVHCLVHDLSAPLASVRASLTLLDEDGLVADSGAELLHIGLSEAERALGYIRSLLDVYAHRSPAGTAPSVPDVRAVVQAIAASFGPTLRRRGLGLIVETGAGNDGDALPVVAEAVALERVLANLLDNAARHAPPGTSVQLTTARDGAHRVRVTVEDAGPGVEVALRPRLFTRFGQGAGGGLAGLGLYYCRVTTEAWGGSVAYADRAGGGASFAVTLVVPTPDADAPER